MGGLSCDPLHDTTDPPTHLRSSPHQWTSLHPPETFSFWKIRLRSIGRCGFNLPGLVYYPHPETKARHWQNPSVLEILAPYIGPICLNQAFELGVDRTAIQILYSVE